MSERRFVYEEIADGGFGFVEWPGYKLVTDKALHDKLLAAGHRYMDEKYGAGTAAAFVAHQKHLYDVNMAEAIAIISSFKDCEK